MTKKIVAILLNSILFCSSIFCMDMDFVYASINENCFVCNSEYNPIKIDGWEEIDPLNASNLEKQISKDILGVLIKYGIMHGSEIYRKYYDADFTYVNVLINARFEFMDFLKHFNKPLQQKVQDAITIINEKYKEFLKQSYPIQIPQGNFREKNHSIKSNAILYATLEMLDSLLELIHGQKPVFLNQHAFSMITHKTFAYFFLENTSEKAFNKYLQLFR